MEAPPTSGTSGSGTTSMQLLNPDPGALIVPEAIPLPGTAPQLLYDSASGVRKNGEEIGENGQDIRTVWQALGGVYSAPEVDLLLRAVDPVANLGDEIAGKMVAVAGALQDFAVSASHLKAQLVDLRKRARRFVELVDDDWKSDSAAVEINIQLKSFSNSRIIAFQEAERECANKITSLFGGTEFVPSGSPKKQGEVEYGTTAEAYNAKIEEMGADIVNPTLRFVDGVGRMLSDNVTVNFWWDMGAVAMTASGYYHPENGWTIDPFERSANSAVFFADLGQSTVKGTANLFGVDFVDGTLMPKGMSAEVAKEAWAGHLHDFFPYTMVDEDPGYAYGTLAFNLATIGIGGVVGKGLKGLKSAAGVDQHQDGGNNGQDDPGTAKDSEKRGLFPGDKRLTQKQYQQQFKDLSTGESLNNATPQDMAKAAVPSGATSQINDAAALAKGGNPNGGDTYSDAGAKEPAKAGASSSSSNTDGSGSSTEGGSGGGSASAANSTGNAQGNNSIWGGSGLSGDDTKIFGEDPANLPGRIAPDGTRYFDDNRSGHEYGESLLGDPKKNPNAYDNLPANQKNAAYHYTVQSWLNPLARTGDWNRAKNLIDAWKGHYEGWQVYEMNGGKTPTLDDIKGANKRTDLTSKQRDLVNEILRSPNPREALEGIKNSAGPLRRMTESFGGVFPTNAELEGKVRGRVEEMNAATQRPLPEQVQVVRGVGDVHFMEGYDGLDVRSIRNTVQTETGFMSTALGKTPPPIDNKDHPIRMYITVPRDGGGLWMGSKSAYPSQRELILPRGTQYFIRNVWDGMDGYTYIDAVVRSKVDLPF
ncbi:ADP-ribosyltransferase [Nocardiopsis baichengensis]|uniref:ADP-ribosyltransferase n=1 Tax=Nocardiopsis baichengensis TaxID=280240 RepID=UPI000345361F|nr:ADP-ribosyltransferase [Nocardiopsis baichengensis]